MMPSQPDVEKAAHVPKSFSATRTIGARAAAADRHDGVAHRGEIPKPVLRVERDVLKPSRAIISATIGAPSRTTPNARFTARSAGEEKPGMVRH
jgi:hypothetical protein